MAARAGEIGRLVGFAVALVALLSSGQPAAAQNFGRAQEALFRIESDAGRSRSGQPIVSGYVYNDYGQYAVGVRLVVEQLDAAGRVTASTGGYVGAVPNLSRAYFEVRLASAPGAFRVRITAFEWVQGVDRE